MSITDRPFAGTWKQFDGILANGRTVSRMVPDCLVYVNGLLTLPGCPACNGQIDLQKYITQVSVDPNIEPIANATISMSIPAFAGEYFFRDGDFLLRPGLEVVIYMRGRYADPYLLTTKDAIALNTGAEGFITAEGELGATGTGGTTSETSFDPTGIPVNPYYQVFHGVVTEASHEYSGGEYTATMSCSDVLHFWQNLKISTNGAVFGPRPGGAASGVEPTLQGHTFQGASPYSIIYTLYRVGFGAAGAVEYSLAQETNVDALSEVSGQTHYKSAALWWEKRWASNSVRLKMYGADGTLYNAWSQSYLGVFSGKNPEQLNKLVGKGSKDLDPFGKSADKSLAKIARDLGYNPLSSQVSIAVGKGGNVTKQDTLKQQAFCLDISILGNVNLFETEYLSKLEIANAVRTITGFEFYQDVSGDLVFKPPMYNMDTSSDPVYVIEDADLISISQSEREPEATYIKGTGTHAAVAGVKGVGLDGWLGMNSTYVDYRLVAQFGWRESEFESSYISDSRALFVLAMNRLDLVNVGCKSASISIPLRPELRPGYPVYVRYLDCFYYIQSMSHQFQFGGQCTTTINGVGKRAKFNAPGVVPGNRAPNIGDIHLENPYLPSLPLTLRLSEIEEHSRGGPTSDPPRIQGFPNVVMALDPTKVNAGSMVFIENLPLDQIVIYALSSGNMQISPDAEGTNESERRLNGPWVISSAANEGVTIARSELQTQWTSLQQALAAGQKFGDIEDVAPSTLVQLLSNVKRSQGLNGDDQSLLNYLVLMNDAKAAFGVSNNVIGTYRYFSCSHPSPEHQGTSNLALVGGTAAPVGTDSLGRSLDFATNMQQTKAETSNVGAELLAAAEARRASSAPGYAEEGAQLEEAAVPPDAVAPAPLDSPAEVKGFIYQPPAPSSTTAATGVGSASGGDSTSLKPMESADIAAFYDGVLTGIGVPVNDANKAFLAAWATQEGTRALYNPLATTWKKTGATAFNCNPNEAGVCNPVRNYTDANQGSAATVATLNQSYFKAITGAMNETPPLTAAQIAVAPGVQDALKVWGGGVIGGGPDYSTNIAQYAAKGVAPPTIWSGDAQAFGRNVGEPPVTEEDVVSGDVGTTTGTTAEVIGFTGQNTIKYGTIKPTAGMKVLQFATTNKGYTPANALEVTVPERTVPTSEIEFVTFASHSLALSTLVLREANGKDLGANLSQPSQASATEMLKGYLLRATSASLDKSLTERYASTYTDVINAIAENLYANATRPEPIAALKAVAYSQPNGTAKGTYYDYVVESQTYYSNLQNALELQKGADDNALDFGLTVQENFTGQKNAPQATSESRGARTICSTLGGGAATFYNLVLSSMQQAAKKLNGTAGYDAAKMTSIYNEMYAGRNAYLQDYASALGLPYTPPVTPTGTVQVSIVKYTKQLTYTPVFPVSDARGYEVVGAQRYGRGITSATLEQIMESTREVTEDGLTLSSRALIGTLSTDATTLEAIEKFYVALGKTGATVSAAFGQLQPETQKALLTAAADVVGGIDTLNEETYSFLVNAIAQTQSYAQKTQYTSNVPANLADIDVQSVGATPCSCKMHDAQTYLLASTGEYVALGSEQEVNEFLLAEARIKAQEWKQARDAMAGQALDSPYSSLAEQFTNTVSGAAAGATTASAFVRNVTPGVG